MAETRADRNVSSRRGQTSITHLFSWPSAPYIRDTYQTRSQRRNLGSSHLVPDKARYVRANYRFVVSQTGDYAAQAADADEPLDWENVLQILASTESQATRCPICLSEPVAPRMAKCGHVFCLPCLYRFINSGEEKRPAFDRKPKWKKCPICGDSIYLAELRPVRFYSGWEEPLPQPGGDVVLRLMKRNAKSTLALPREVFVDPLNSFRDVPWHFAAGILDYARIMKGTTGYMLGQFDREIADLVKQEAEDEMMFGEDGEWTQRSIQAISTAKEKAAEIGDATSAVTDNEGASSSSQASQTDHDFYFYAALPHLYLSPLDIRILKTTYGSFDKFPVTLLPRVEHVSTGHVVDDVLRRRARYLGHVPAGCIVSFLECDWTDIVPAAILSTFAADLERRRQANRDKAAQEERERLDAERLEAAAARGARRGLPPGVLDHRDDDAAPNPAVVHPADFAPLGADARTPPNPRPGFGQLAALSTSPTASRTVWGTPAVAASPELLARPDHDVNDGWLRDDQFSAELGPADLTVPMEALGLEAAGPDAPLAPTAAPPRRRRSRRLRS